MLEDARLPQATCPSDEGCPAAELEAFKKEKEALIHAICRDHVPSDKDPEQPPPLRSFRPSQILIHNGSSRVCFTDISNLQLYCISSNQLTRFYRFHHEGKPKKCV